MVHGQTRRTDRRWGVCLDVFHLVVGVLIVAFAVLSFLNPEGNEFLFPLVFFLAAALNAATALFELKIKRDDKKMHHLGILHLVLMVILMGIGILSAASMWG